MTSSRTNPVSAKALGNGITLYQAEQYPGLWKIWARLSLDVPLAEYKNISQPELELLMKRLEDKYSHISMDQLMMLCED
ncbi:MAG: hypothetical protein ACI4O0_06700 [Candidatus Limivicinus sp.]